MKKREKGIVDRGTSCEETEMGEDLGTFRGNHNVRDDCIIGQGAKSLGDQDWTACGIIEDFGFFCVGYEEPSDIFTSGGDRMGLIFGNPTFEAW